MMIYFYLLIANKMFQIEFLIMLTALCLFIDFAFIWQKCDFHFNLKFNQIFNILKFVLGLIQCSFNVMLTFMLYLFKVFEKWINSCFRSLNLKLCFFVHSTILFYVFFNISQFRFVNLLYINILMSFMNSMILKRSLTFLHDFNKFAL